MDLFPTIQRLSPALLSAIVSGLLSFIFNVIGPARDWFDQFTTQQKQNAVAIVTVLVGAIIGAINFIYYGFNADSLIILALCVYTSVTSAQTVNPLTKQTPPQPPV